MKMFSFRVVLQTLKGNWIEEHYEALGRDVPDAIMSIYRYFSQCPEYRSNPYQRILITQWSNRDANS